MSKTPLQAALNIIFILLNYFPLPFIGTSGQDRALWWSSILSLGWQEFKPNRLVA